MRHAACEPVSPPPPCSPLSNRQTDNSWKQERYTSVYTRAHIAVLFHPCLQNIKNSLP